MNRRTSIFILAASFSALLLSSCGIVPRSVQPVEREARVPAKTERVDTLSVIPPVERETAIPGKSNYPEDSRVLSVNEKLYSAFQEWEGTPYLFGGSGRNGIDCSAFTQRVLGDYFDTSISRNTRSQLQEGISVRRNHIQPGDLIFFRTDRGVLHVGIAMGDGDFLHASFSNGVMISNISERYWAGRYLGTRRVL